MAKSKVYEYQGRTFEVKAYSEEAYRDFLLIYVDEVIHPNRKFFGRTRFFYYDFVLLNQYPSIDDAVKEVIASGLWQEKYKKSIENKWKEWNK